MGAQVATCKALTAASGLHENQPVKQQMAACQQGRQDQLPPTGATGRGQPMAGTQPSAGRTSMLPVSGALQLNTSEAHTLRPICSLKKAYSRLLRRLQGKQARFRGAHLCSLAAACWWKCTHVRRDWAALHTSCHCVIGTPEACALRVQQGAHGTDQPLNGWLRACTADALVGVQLWPHRQHQHCVTCRPEGGALTLAPCHRGNQPFSPCPLAATDSTSPALAPWPAGDSSLWHQCIRHHHRCRRTTQPGNEACKHVTSRASRSKVCKAQLLCTLVQPV